MHQTSRSYSTTVLMLMSTNFIYSVYQIPGVRISVMLLCCHIIMKTERRVLMHTVQMSVGKISKNKITMSNLVNRVEKTKLISDYFHTDVT